MLLIINIILRLFLSIIIFHQSETDRKRQDINGLWFLLSYLLKKIEFSKNLMYFVMKKLLNKPFIIFYTMTTKQSLKKHLSAEGLLSATRKVFASVKDPEKDSRGKKSKLPLVDCLMSGLAVFGLIYN